MFTVLLAIIGTWRANETRRTKTGDFKMAQGIKNMAFSRGVSLGSIVNRRLANPRGGLGTLAAMDAQKKLDAITRQQIAAMQK